MSFEFMYATSWYRYENSYIYKQNRFGDYAKLCPVLPDLVRKLEIQFKRPNTPIKDEDDDGDEN